MNADAAAGVASAVADQVAAGLSDGSALLVLGGDCTVELGTVAGASRGTPDVGLVYIDYDTDMNTPQSVEDGALDWMGVAHLLGLPDTVPSLAGVGPRTPMLRPDQVLLFANGSSTDFERRTIDELGIQEVRLAQVSVRPGGLRARRRRRLGATLRAPPRPRRRGRPGLPRLPDRRGDSSVPGTPVRAARGRTSRARRRAELDDAHDLRGQPRPRPGRLVHAQAQRSPRRRPVRRPWPCRPTALAHVERLGWRARQIRAADAIRIRIPIEAQGIRVTAEGA